MKLKICFVGGSSFVVDLTKDVVSLGRGRIGVFSEEEITDSRAFSNSLEKFIVPLDMIEGFEIIV